MPGFLGKFSEFPASCLNFMLIFNKIFEISQMYGFSGSFPNAPNFFSGNSSDFSNSCWNLIMMYLLILEISQMPGYFGNFQNSWLSGKFFEISQMYGFSGSFPHAWVLGRFPKCLVFCLEIYQIPSFFWEILRISQIPVGIW